MVTTPELFAARLLKAAADAERRANELETKWGEATVGELKRRVAVDTGRGRDSIHQEDSGEIWMLDYLELVDRGTSRMAPQEFKRPSLNAVLPRIRKEGLEAGVDWIT